MPETERQSKDCISRTAIFSAIVSEAVGFYRLVTLTSGGFLIGSLIFIGMISTNLKQETMSLLLISWSMLIASIGSIAFVRMRNLESGRLALEGRNAEAARIDWWKSVFSYVAIILLANGMVGTMAFCWENLAAGGK